MCELIDKPFKFFINYEHNELNQYFQEVITGASKSGKLLIQNKNEDILNTSIKVIPIKVEKEIVGVYGIFKDITEVVKMIEKLEVSEKRFRMIAENANDLITVINNEGRISFISRHLEVY